MRIGLHNQWTTTYSWHHQSVCHNVIIHWLVVFFSYFCLFSLCSLIIVRYHMSLFAAVHVNLIYRLRWSVVASVQSKMFVLQYAVFLSSMGCTAVNTWCKFFSWLAGVSSWLAGVSSWLARVSSGWLESLPGWLEFVSGWLQSLIFAFPICVPLNAATSVPYFPMGRSI